MFKNPIVRKRDLVCPTCGYHFEDLDSRDAHVPCPEGEQ